MSKFINENLFYVTYCEKGFSNAIQYGCVCDTMEEAIAMIREKFPDCRVKEIRQTDMRVMRKSTKTITVDI